MLSKIHLELHNNLFVRNLSIFPHNNSWFLPVIRWGGGGGGGGGISIPQLFIFTQSPHVSCIQWTNQVISVFL